MPIHVLERELCSGISMIEQHIFGILYWSCNGRSLPSSSTRDHALPGSTCFHSKQYYVCVSFTKNTWYACNLHHVRFIYDVYNAVILEQCMCQTVIAGFVHLWVHLMHQLVVSCWVLCIYSEAHTKECHGLMTKMKMGYDEQRTKSYSQIISDAHLFTCLSTACFLRRPWDFNALWQ